MECQDAATNFHKDLKLYDFKRFYDILNLDTPRELVQTQLPLPCARHAGSVVKVVPEHLFLITSLILVHTKV